MNGQRETGNAIRQDAGFLILGVLIAAIGFALSGTWGGFTLVGVFFALAAFFAAIRLGWRLAFSS